MPLFTALEVKPFSGFYPSCQQCLRRLSVTEKPRKGSPCGEQFHCRGCDIAYYGGDVKWRYCVRVTAQCEQEHREMVVFGDCLNAVFGAPAADLRRFLFSCFPESLSLLSPLGLCHVLLEPLQSVLSGKCFTANLTVSRNTRSEGKQEKRRTARYVANGFQLLGDVVSVSVVSILAREVGRRMIADTLSNTPPVPNMLLSVPLTQVVRKHEEQDCVPDDSSSTSNGNSLMCSLQTISSQQVMLDFCSLCVSEAHQTSHSNSKSLPTAQEKGSLSFPFLTNDRSAFECLVSPNQCKTDSFCPKCVFRSPSCCVLSLDLAALCDEAVDDVIATQGHHQSHDLSSSFMSPCTQGNCMSFSGVGKAFCSSCSQTASYTYDEVLPDSESFLVEFQGDFEPSLVQASSSHSPSPLTQDQIKNRNPLPPTQGEHLKPLKKCTPNTGSHEGGWQVPPVHLRSASTPAGCGLLSLLGCSPELFTGSITNSPVTSAAEYFSPELFSSPPLSHSSSSMLQPAVGMHASGVDLHASSVGVRAHTPAVGSGFRSSINPRRNILEGNLVGANFSPVNSKTCTALGSPIKH